MSYSVVPSKRFRKAVEKYRRGGRKRILEAAEEAIDLLAIRDDRSLFVLSKQWKDHSLRGDKHGTRELHLSQEDLLLYTIDGGLRIVKLLDIVSHEDLRRQ